MRQSPAYVQDEAHHGGWVVIITTLGTVLVLLCLCIRLYVRLRYSSTHHAADGVLAVAGLFAIVQSCLIFWEVAEGLGTSMHLLKPEKVHLLTKSSFAATVLYLFTVYLSKCCVLCVYLHLSPKKSQNRASWIVMAFASIWILCSILMIGIDCSLSRPWNNIASQCNNVYTRWQVVTGLDVTIEILLFVLSIYLVAPTQMPLKRKSIVVTAFGIRLLVIVPTILRLHFMKRQIHSSDPTLAAANTVIFSEIQMHFSVICAVTYCFRSFTTAVSTNYGCAAINLDLYEETNGDRSAYSSSRKPSKTPSASLADDKFVGYNTRYASNTVITGGARGSAMRSAERRKSGESTMVIIEEEVHVESSRATPTKEITDE